MSKNNKVVSAMITGEIANDPLAVGNKVEGRLVEITEYDTYVEINIDGLIYSSTVDFGRGIKPH